MKKLADQFAGNFDYIDHEVIYWRELPEVPKTIWVAKPDVVLSRPGDEGMVTVEIKQSSWDINMRALAFDRQVLSQLWTSGASSALRLFFYFEAPPPRSTKPVKVTLSQETILPDRLLISEWLAERQQVIGSINRAIEAKVFVKRAPDACHEFKRTCPYIDLCPLGVGAQFVADAENKTNPLSYLGL
jgi:hypothetical protein